MYCHIHHCHYHHCHCVPKDSKEKGGALTQEELLALTEEMKDELKDYTVDLKDQIFSYIDIGVNPVEIANTFASLKEQDTYILRTLTNKIDELNNTTNLSMYNLRTRVTDLEGQSATFISDLVDRTQRIDELEDNLSSLPIEGNYITIDSFEAGATITQRNEALRHIATDKLYRWAGDLPKVVSANSTPTSSGGIGTNAWLEVSEVTLRQELANPDKGAVIVGFIQNEETIAIPQNIKERDSQTQLATDYISIKDAVEGAKRHNTSSLTIPLGTYQVTDTINLTGYHHLEGKGDASVLSLAPGVVGLDYVNRAGTFDDHPHRTLKNFRVRGDGQLTVPSSQEDRTGTTTGYQNTVHGSFFMQEGMTYEYNLVGCRIDRGYTNMGLYNHYRSNGIGLLLHRVTSHTEQMLYARYNTEAAVKIESGQNIKLLGGAVEGNSLGVGLRVTNDFNNNQSIVLDDIYMEVNGDIDKGIPSVQVDYHPTTRIKVVGGSYWRNIQNGITSGIYDWGRYVSFDSSTLGGGSYHLAEQMSIRQGCYVAGMILASNTESINLPGLEAREPTIMKEFKPGYLSTDSNPMGLVFQTAFQGMSSTYKGQDNLITPGYPNGGAGTLIINTSTEREDLDYGDGSWTNFQFSNTGSYSSEYATLCTYAEPDASDHPWKLVTFLVRADSDCTIGFVGAGTTATDTAISAALRLLGGKTYRITTIAYRTSAGVFRLRAFSMDGPASFSWLPHYFYIFKGMDPCISFANHVVSGAY